MGLRMDCTVAKPLRKAASNRLRHTGIKRMMAPMQIEGKGAIVEVCFSDRQIHLPNNPTRRTQNSFPQSTLSSESVARPDGSPSFARLQRMQGRVALCN